MKKSFKKVVLIVVALIIILIFLNPNIASFKNYARNFGDPSYVIYKRDANYFLFSIYEKQTDKEIQKYFGFVGNFFRTENNIVSSQAKITVSEDSVTAIEDSAKSLIDTLMDFGPNAYVWMDDFGVYYNKNPNASDDELYKRFPHLDHNKKKLIEGVSYDQAKKMQGMTDYKLRTLFPELFRDELYYQWHKL